MSTHVVILAAGKGSRMRSAQPKVLAKLANRPLLAHVIEAAKHLTNSKLHIVIGHGADQVKSAFEGEDINWVVQKKQLGTGDAVKSGLKDIPDDANVLVLYGDVPLIKPSTIEPLIKHLGSSDVCVLTAILENATGYGRITRDPNQRVSGIIEHKDASAEQLTIDEVNTGIISARADKLKKWLNQITPNNAQGEYYLTDIIGLAYADDCNIEAEYATTIYEVTGVNSRIELAELERTYQTEITTRYLNEGLTIIDPARLDVRGNLIFGTDCVIDVNVIINGDVSLGDNVTIHSNCVLSNCSIGSNSVIHPNSVIEDSIIGQSGNIGPFARLRPGTKLADKVKVGNFVELKKAQIAKGAKVNHLSYIGDSIIGEATNIGAGTITCNYDGVNKYQTVIGKNAFIGSNSQLVAPVVIEDNATVAAGSTITSDVPEANLSIARSKQRNLSGWRRPTKTNK